MKEILLTFNHQKWNLTAASQSQIVITKAHQNLIQAKAAKKAARAARKPRLFKSDLDLDLDGECPQTTVSSMPTLLEEKLISQMVTKLVHMDLQLGITPTWMPMMDRMMKRSLPNSNTTNLKDQQRLIWEN